jgi:bifunctional DNA-binding transcriptional regulator/antitoxin component of YhaV-PrlF toxin-antitoxin module
MTIFLTVTAKGQVTLRKELLAHLGVRPGQRLDVEVLPGGLLQLHDHQATFL